MLDLFRACADRGWVRYGCDGQVDALKVVDAAVALLPTLGYRVASCYKGTGPDNAVGWARWSSRWYPDAPLLLEVDGHALVARDGLLYDNNCPNGLSGAEHPYAAARVRVVLPVCKNADEAIARRWVVPE